MAQILVRGLDEQVVEKLKSRAEREGRSIQAEVKAILEDATKADMDSARQMLEEFSRRFAGRKFSDSAELIREDRER